MATIVNKSGAKRSKSASNNVSQDPRTGVVNPDGTPIYTPAQIADQQAIANNNRGSSGFDGFIEGASDLIGQGARKAWDTTVPGIVSNSVQHGIPDALGRTIPGTIRNAAVDQVSKVAAGAYDSAYGTGDQKSALDQASAGIQAAGQRAAAGYDARGASTLNYYAPADAALQSWQADPSTYQQDTYQSAAARGSGTNAANYYSGMQAPTAGATYANLRGMTGYGADPLASRYAERSATGTPDYLSSQLPSINAYATGPTGIDTRISQRQSALNTPTTTSGMLGELAGMNAGYRADAMAGDYLHQDAGANAGQFSDMIDAGNTYGARQLSQQTSGNTAGGRMLTGLQSGEGDSAQLLRNMAGGTSETGKLQSRIGSTQGDTGSWLDSYDPNKATASQDTYDKLAARGPSYEEDFYTSQLAGTNPAYNQLQADFTRDTQRSAAARGGFVSGHAMDLEERGRSRLAADEFANRGQLAANAGAAERARMGQLQTGASALDSQLLNQNQLRVQAGLGRENTMAGLATARENNMSGLATGRENTMAGLASSGDSTAASLANQQDALRGTMSTSRDTSDIAKRGILADLAKSSDASNLDLAGMRLQGAGQEDTLQAGRQSALDSLYTDNEAAGLARRSLGVNASNMADQTSLTGNRDIDTLAGNYSGSQFERGKQIDSLYRAAIGDTNAYEDRRAGAAASADQGELARDKYISDAAKGASDEKTGRQRDLFDAALRSGDSKAMQKQAYDMAAQGALTAADISSMDLQLQKAGLDAAARSAFKNDLLKVAGLIATVA